MQTKQPNCKAGDRAIITRVHKSVVGSIVDVIAEAPKGESFDLPNGKKQQKIDDMEGVYWIVKILGNPFLVPTSTGGAAKTEYIVASDTVLTALTTELGDDEIDY